MRHTVKHFQDIVGFFFDNEKSEKQRKCRYVLLNFVGLHQNNRLRVAIIVYTPTFWFHITKWWVNFNYYLLMVSMATQLPIIHCSLCTSRYFFFVAFDSIHWKLTNQLESNLINLMYHSRKKDLKWLTWNLKCIPIDASPLCHVDKTNPIVYRRP